MIGRKLSFSFMVKLLIQGLGFISLFFVARYMGAEALGIIAFGMSFIGIFQSFSDFGFGTAHIKRVSEGKDLGRCNGTYFTVRIILLVVMSAIILGTIFYSKYVQQQPFISREHEIVLYLLLVSNFIGSVSMAFDITFGARKEVAKSQLGALIGKVVLVAGKVAVALSGLGVVVLASVNIVSSLAVLVFYIYLFKDYPIKAPTREYFKSYATFAVPVILIGFVSKFAANIDKVMIQFFWSATDVGFYAAAVQVSLIVSSAAQLSSVLVFPTISRFHAQGDIASIRDLSNRAERFLSMVVLPVAVFLLLFSPQICGLLLGAEFLTVAPRILAIFGFIIYLNAITANYISQISGTNHIRLSAVLSFVTFGIHIILNVVFIPREFLGFTLLGMGAVGAALATLLGAAVSAIVYRVFAYRITGSTTNPVIFIHWLAAVVMAGVMLGLSSLTSNVMWYHALLYGAIGFLAYLGVLGAAKEFGRREINYFWSILNPAQLKNYAVKEMGTGYREDPEQA